MKIGFKQIVLTTALAGAVAPVALAQSADNPFARGRYTAVTERSQSEFDPEAVRAGAFDIWSSLGLGLDYNSNIFAQPKDQDNDTEDTIYRVNPSIEARSNWSSHELSAGVSLDYSDYHRFETETVTTYNAFVNGRLDVLRTFQLTGQVTGAHLAEQRYEPGSSSNAAVPTEWDRLGANVGALWRTDRIQLEGTFGQTGEDYDTVANYRDATETFLLGRGSYAISPDVAIFVQGRTSDIDYESSDRSGTRSTVQVGASFELQAPFRGEIAIGSVTEDKDSLAYQDTETLSVDANLMWFPTQLTTITFTGNSGIFDTGVVESPTTTATSFGVRADHELMRNVLLFGSIRNGKYVFESPPPPNQFDREDEFTDFEAGVGYKVNKRARFDVSYRFHTQSSSGVDADRDLEQHILGARLTIYP
jgi:hypothetical protein